MIISVLFAIFKTKILIQISMKVVIEWCHLGEEM